jgi:hypothetical protein
MTDGARQITQVLGKARRALDRRAGPRVSAEVIPSARRSGILAEYPAEAIDAAFSNFDWFMRRALQRLRAALARTREATPSRQLELRRISPSVEQSNTAKRKRMRKTINGK